MYCKICGEKIDDNSIFCSICGVPVKKQSHNAINSFSDTANDYSAPIDINSPQKKKKKPKINVICRKHPMAYFFDVVIVALYSILSLYIISVSIDFNDKIMAIAGYVLLGFGVLSFLISFLRNLTEFITITPEGVTGRKGLLFSDTLKSPIPNVMDVGIRNGPVGKLFNYHNIAVSTAGTGNKEFMFSDMKNAKEFQDAFIVLSNGR